MVWSLFPTFATQLLQFWYFWESVCVVVGIDNGSTRCVSFLCFCLDRKRFGLIKPSGSILERFLYLSSLILLLFLFASILGPQRLCLLTKYWSILVDVLGSMWVLLAVSVHVDSLAIRIGFGWDHSTVCLLLSSPHVILVIYFRRWKLHVALWAVFFLSLLSLIGLKPGVDIFIYLCVILSLSSLEIP